MNTIQRMVRSALFSRLRAARRGCLTVHDSEDTQVFGAASGSSATVVVQDDRFYATVARGGHIGAAEAYASGWWSTPDLTAVIRFFLQNRQLLDGLETGPAKLMAWVRSLTQALRRNTRGGSRRNISAHYDLSNEFFSMILDETMTYSCAHFEHEEATLEDASIAKYDRLCRKLELHPGERVIEIGTGWGGFAMHAAKYYGCDVTTTTISAEQRTGAIDRIRKAGLDRSIRVLERDYRDLEGTWDKLVSIEMIEAVGHQYYRTFFEKCASLLEPHGMAAIQAITIQDHLYEQALRETDFIKEYIFPGSSIPSVSVLLQSAAGTDFRLVHADDQGPHYARTLREWWANLERNASRIEALGFDTRFRRLWEFYFAYCEGGFEEGVLGNAQLLFAKPAAARTLRGSRFEWVSAA